jgi:hypothetical protein
LPTVLRVGPFRFFFFSNEGAEQPHIHVKAGDNQAKFWLDPAELVANYGFNVRQLGQIEQIVADYRDDLLEAWNEHLGT